MNAKFLCGSCGHEIAVQFLKPGEIAKCKSCGAENVVPTERAMADGAIPKASVAKPAANQVQVIQTPAAPVILRSPAIGSFASLLLWIGVAFDCAALLLAALASTSSESASAPVAVGRFILHHTSANWNALSSGGVSFLGIYLLFGIASLIAILVWIYRLHRDLNELYPGYRIGPGRAVAAVLIPVYNIWGIWCVVSSISRTLRLDSDRLQSLGRSLFAWLGTFYILNVVAFFSYIPARTSDFWSIFHWLSLLLISVVGLLMVVIIRRAISFKRDQVNRAFSAN